MKNIAIIFAGGVGSRLKSEHSTLPKQFLKINNKEIIIHTLEAFQTHELVDKIYISIHPNFFDFMQGLVKYYHLSKVCGVVKGGANGQKSIFNALNLAYKENGGENLVLIHDGVRPNIEKWVISNNIETASKFGNAITATNCTETIVVSQNGVNPTLIPARHELYCAKAPQTFKLGEIYEAHKKMQEINPSYEGIIDSATLFDKLGKKLFMTESNGGNIKITTIEDLYILRALIRMKEDKVVFGL